MKTKPKTEKPKQDKSKLDNTVHSLLLQNEPGLAERHCWLLGGFSTHVLGAISLMKQRHPCREATNTATATFDNHTCLYTSVKWSELIVRAFAFFYTTFPTKLHDPLKNKQTNPPTLFPWPDPVSPKERATCACADGLLSKRALWFVKLTPGEWDKEEFHPQAEWAMPQVSSRALLQRRLPEEGGIGPMWARLLCVA